MFLLFVILWRTLFIHFLSLNCSDFDAPTTIIDLPDLAIIHIFSYFELEELLTIVNRTCQRFYQIIKFTSSLWRIFEFSRSLHLYKKDLEYILLHSRCFSVFDISLSYYKDSTASLDFLLSSNISQSTNLTWLDLSHSDISTTCFLLQLPNLEYLNLSQCEHLVDVDFLVISNCHKLTNLYLSFDTVAPITILYIVHFLNFIDTLDICGIPLSIEEIDAILTKCYTTLLSLHLSLRPDINEDQFHEFVHFNYTDLTYYLCNKY